MAKKNETPVEEVEETSAVEIKLADGYVVAECTECGETVASKTISPRVLREASEHTHTEEE